MTGRLRTASRCGVMLLMANVMAFGRAAATEMPVHEVQIVASKFTFEPSTIPVTAGEPLRLVVRSRDGTHGLAIPKLKIEVRLAKTGEPVEVIFTAPPAGRYEIACSEFCGSGHGQMKAALISAATVTTTG